MTHPILLAAIVAQLLVGCRKLLNEKPSSDMLIPSTLADFNSLLQDIYNMNRTPGLGDISAGNYTLNFAFWQILPATQRNAHIWAHNVYGSDLQIDDWKTPYRQVLNSNVILEGLESVPLTANNRIEWRRVKGAALFFKAHAIFQVAQVFAPHYDSATAAASMGVPLRPSASISVKSVRASVQETYSLILGHLKEAARLLDTIDHQQLNLPSRPAALGLLARTYLTIGNFDSALTCATSALANYTFLQDYNQINTKSGFPFKGKNHEIIFLTEMVTSATCLQGLVNPSTFVDSALLSLYQPSDLRKQAFFQVNSSNGLATIKASYSGTIFQFTGIACDELMLIKAECQARLGNWKDAMDTLNGLLVYRWKTGTFIPLTAAGQAEALAIILGERRKELPFRGLSWTDLRRLSKEGLTPTLNRKLDSNHYMLPPGDKRYVLPIPYDVISLSGMPQNPR